MAKKKNKEKDYTDKCAGFGTAYEDSDNTCKKCMIAELCAEKTNGVSEEKKDKRKKDKRKKDKNENTTDTDGKQDEATETGPKPPKKTGDKTMDVLNSIDFTLKQMLILLQNQGSGSRRGGGKTAKEKQEVKKHLVAGIPYEEAALKALGARRLKMLGSAIGVKTFGKGVDTILPEILKSQKKKEIKAMAAQAQNDGFGNQE